MGAGFAFFDDTTKSTLRANRRAWMPCLCDVLVDQPAPLGGGAIKHEFVTIRHYVASVRATGVPLAITADQLRAAVRWEVRLPYDALVDETNRLRVTLNDPALPPIVRTLQVVAVDTPSSHLTRVLVHATSLVSPSVMAIVGVDPLAPVDGMQSYFDLGSASAAPAFMVLDAPAAPDRADAVPATLVLDAT